jgi:RNA polymerase sigma-70 factor (ECF subfamily)
MIMTDTSDSLLERIRLEADPASWQRLTDLYTPWLRGWLRRYVSPPSAAEELVREVLVLLVRELPRFHDDLRPGAFRRALRTTMVNSLRTFWQVRRARSTTGDASAFENSFEQFADDDSAVSRLWDEEHDRHVVRRLLELMKPEFEPATWQAFHLLVLEGKRTAEVAAELGISTNAVRIAKARIQSRLRQEAEGLID